MSTFVTSLALDIDRVEKPSLIHVILLLLNLDENLHAHIFQGIVWPVHFTKYSAERVFLVDRQASLEDK
jgi:hypothetical protein